MKNSIALITIIAALAGCAEETSDEVDRIVTSTVLSTTWKLECVVDGENSYLPVLTFATNGGQFYDSGTGTRSNIYHTGDITCASTEQEVRNLTTFNYALGSDVSVDGSIAEITEAMQIDITNTTEGSVDFGVVEYDIFAIKDRLTLYFGDKAAANDGSTAALRPTQLTDSVIYSR